MEINIIKITTNDEENPIIYRTSRGEDKIRPESNIANVKNVMPETDELMRI